MNLVGKGKSGGEMLVLFNAKEHKSNIHNLQVDYITFGNGKKPLVMIQGLNTRGIKLTDRI